jgi:hypothetical protein
MPATGVLGSQNAYLGNVLLGVLTENDGTILVETVLALVQDVTTNFDDRPVDDTLVMSQSVVVTKSRTISVETDLGLDDGINGTLQMDVETELLIEQANHLQWDRSLSDTLALVSSFNTEQHIRHPMTIVSDVDVEQIKPMSSTLAIEQALQVTVIYNRSLETEMDLSQTLAYFLPNDASECNFSPFIGGGDVEYTLPDTTAPVFGSATLTLTYPYVAPTTTLVLRNPDFGNNDRLSFQRINRVTRGGTLVVFADPNWPKQEVLSVQVSWLKATEARDLLDFIEDSLGQEIGLLDWEGNQWRGIITTPDAAITHNGRHNRVISFEFEGELA